MDTLYEPRRYSQHSMYYNSQSWPNLAARLDLLQLVAGVTFANVAWNLVRKVPFLEIGRPGRRGAD